MKRFLRLKQPATWPTFIAGKFAGLYALYFSLFILGSMTMIDPELRDGAWWLAYREKFLEGGWIALPIAIAGGLLLIQKPPRRSPTANMPAGPDRRRPELIDPDV